VPQGRRDTHFSHCDEAGLCNRGRMRLLLLQPVSAMQRSREGQPRSGVVEREQPSRYRLGRSLRLSLPHLLPGAAGASIVGGTRFLFVHQLAIAAYLPERLVYLSGWMAPAVADPRWSSLRRLHGPSLTPLLHCSEAALQLAENRCSYFSLNTVSSSSFIVTDVFSSGRL
jgi:hypothetical protein